MAGNILSAIIDVKLSQDSRTAFAQTSELTKKTEASVKTLTPAISKLGSSLNALKFAVLDRKEELIRTTDIGRAKELNLQIRQLEREMKRLQTSGTSSFGAIGSSASKTFGVVRSLAYVLPGIGIAGIFSAVGAGISTLVSSVLTLGRSYNFAAADAEVFRAANKSVGDDMARLGALVSVARDVSASTLQRTNAIAELQKLYPNYLRNISLENINSAAAALAIDNLTKSIVSKAIATAYSSKVAEESLVLLDKQEKVNVLLAKQGAAAAELNTRRLTEPADAVKKLTGLYNENNNKLQGATNEMNRQQEVVNKLTGRLKDATAASLDFFATPKEAKGGTKAFDDIINQAREVAKFLTDKSFFKVEFETVPFESKEQTAARAKQFIKDALQGTLKLPTELQFDEGLLKEFRRRIEEIQKNRIRINAEIQLSASDQAKNMEALGNQVEKMGQSKAIRFNVNVDPQVILNAEKLQRDLDQLNSQIASSIVSAAENIAGSIGEAIGGKKNAGKALIGIIADLISQIGKALVAFGVAKTGIDKILQNPLLPGGVAIGLGLLAIAAAALLKSSQARALGGPVRKGQSYIVGEQGPELFVPDTGGQIVSNSKLSAGQGIAASGGMSVQVAGQFVIRGNDLLATIANAQRSQGRLG